MPVPRPRLISLLVISLLVTWAETVTHFVFAFLPRPGPDYVGEFHRCPRFLRTLYISSWPLTVGEINQNLQQFDADQIGAFSAFIYLSLTLHNSEPFSHPMCSFPSQRLRVPLRYLDRGRAGGVWDEREQQAPRGRADKRTAASTCVGGRGSEVLEKRLAAAGLAMYTQHSIPLFLSSLEIIYSGL